MLKHKKALAMLLCVAVVCTLVFSMLFIVAELNHDCSGEGCPVCLEIQSCQEALKTIGTALAFAVSACITVFFSAVCVKRFAENDSFYTPVLLKVKLTN